MRLTEANSIPRRGITVCLVRKFILLSKTDGENKSGVKTRGGWLGGGVGGMGGRHKGRLGGIERAGEENEPGRQANTYVTRACVFTSLSSEPDTAKDSTPVSSAPSERQNEGRHT